jgi:Ribosomal protein L30E
MDKALGYLALCSKSGKLVVGADNCVQALGRGKAKLLLLASDASPNAIKRAEGMTYGRKIPLLRCTITKQELADATGENGLVAIAAICDKGLARAFLNTVQCAERNEEE